MITTTKKNKAYQKIKDDAFLIGVKVLKERFLPQAKRFLKVLCEDLQEDIANDNEIKFYKTKPFSVKYSKTLYRGIEGVEDLKYRFYFLKKEEFAFFQIFKECAFFAEKDTKSSPQTDKLYKKRKAIFNRIMRSFTLYKQKFEKTVKSFESLVENNPFFVIKKLPYEFMNL